MEVLAGVFILGTGNGVVSRIELVSTHLRIHADNIVRVQPCSQDLRQQSLPNRRASDTACNMPVRVCALLLHACVRGFHVRVMPARHVKANEYGRNRNELQDAQIH